MKSGLFSDAHIMRVLYQAEGGVSVFNLCCEHGIILHVVGQICWSGRILISKFKDMAEQIVG